ncbi:unnamed protein product [Cuscuta epithymum]|nr:unnamed protein product [Cuscuta epithymum]
MSLEELIVRLRIEEDTRKSKHKAGRSNSMEAKANMVEAGSKKGKKRKHDDEGKKRKHDDEGISGAKPSSKEFKGKCYNCGKPGHRVKDCRAPKKKKKGQVNMVDNL